MGGDDLVQSLAYKKGDRGGAVVYNSQRAECATSSRNGPVLGITELKPVHDIHLADEARR